jgi:hypothetical protein
LAVGTLGLNVKSNSSTDLRSLEVRLAEAGVELLGTTALDLVGEQPKKNLGVRNIVVDSLAQADVERQQYAREAKPLQDGMRSSVGSVGIGGCEVEDFLNVAGESWG